ncbi:putative cyclin-dependent kinase F-2 [Hordeum vulgare]|uniref:[RNA-polymerase]-subunit kinase n=2 Tax=Hordeum vulgare subsp. vulgare TaxID=112509 RepID=A0A8I6XD30_HORVV|nr:putative cyclin-dependent kinase F-2 [Hordeum vulgare]KAI4991259.1 hypothetical protein ZWY2020_039630 [Hordeum vulgare]
MAVVDDQRAATAGKNPAIAYRVASICAMLDEHDATETPMSASRVAAVYSMIADVANAAAEGRMTGRRRWKPYTGIARRYDYLELRSLGDGASADVTKARHHATGHTVALKTIRVDSYSAGAVELLREACFMAACHGHPSLVRLHGLARDPDSGVYSLAMECLGPSLHHALRDRVARTGRPFPEASVRLMMRQLLSGAAELHKNLIIHRDIKPDNILVAVDGAVKIGDYGSALSIAGQNDDDAYWAAGTRTCCAPEMLLEKPGYDTLVDTWSLGCVMAELLTGEALFKEHCDSDQLHRIYDVFGVPGKREWKPYESSFVADKVPVWRREQAQQRRRGRWHSNRLRELVPEKLLSKEGFEVLKGLLACNPNKRLAAAAAIKLPWFADNDHAPVELQVTVGH